MAYIDILSPDAYGRYNRKLSRLTNLTVAVYWSEILDISTKVVKKKKYDEEGFFTIDRKYVEERTTISLNEQLDCDAILHNLGVLDVNELDVCKIRIKLAEMVQILADDHTQEVLAAKKKTKVNKTQAAANKTAGIIITMKKCLSESDPDLRSKYEEWIEAVYAAKRFLTKAKIKIFEDAINAYSTDKQVKLGLIDAGILSGYDTPEWVINRYQSSNRSVPNTVVHLPEQKVATADTVNTDLPF